MAAGIIAAADLPLSGTTFAGPFLPGPLKIRDYRVIISVAEGRPYLLLTRRIVLEDGQLLYYYIDMSTLEYGISDSLEPSGDSSQSLTGLYEKLHRHLMASGKPYTGGHAPGISKRDMNLLMTTDLCPTRRSLDLRFYKILAKLHSSENRVLPLIIFFSGNWILQHPEGLRAIRDSRIPFLAGNHTRSHIMKRGNRHLDRLDEEIVATELIMLRTGLLPSFYFRYPGLRHRKKDMATLLRLNMVPLDANIWMGSRIRNWGILLVHSNGHVPSEVRAFIRFVSKNRERMRKGGLIFHSVADFLESLTDITESPAGKM